MRKTKIVCTLGPSTDQPGILRQLLENGMNVARFNFCLLYTSPSPRDS